MSDVTQEVDFNPLDPRYVSDPFPMYKPLMQGPPRQVHLGQITTLIARYDHAVKVLYDPYNFKNEIPQDEVNAALDVFGAKVISFADEPLHNRLRKTVRRTFSAQSVREFRPKAEEIVRQLILPLRDQPEFDVVSELAYLLPLYMICWLMDLPEEHHALYRQWASALSSIGRTMPGDPVPKAFFEARDSWRKYFSEMLDRRLREPRRQDFLGEMIDAHRQGQLSYEEAVDMMMLILLAGQDTTASLIASLTKNLLTHPDALAAVRSRPELIPKAVEETMRYDNSVLLITRYAKSDMTFEGTRIPAGSSVFLILAAANRDPAKFPDPDRYDIARDPNEHLGLGEGIHFCLGAFLARMENQVAIASLLEAFPRLRLANPEGPFQYNGGQRSRSLSELRVLPE